MITHRFRLPLIIFFLTVSCIFAIDTAAGQELEVKIKENRLTLHAQSVPIEQILLEIEEQSNIVVHILVSLGNKVSVDAQGIPLQQGLKLLMRDFNHSFVYTMPNDKNQPEISEIYITSRSDKNDIHLALTPDTSVSKAGLTPVTELPEYAPPSLMAMTHPDHPYQSANSHENLLEGGDPFYQMGPMK